MIYCGITNDYADTNDYGGDSLCLFAPTELQRIPRMGELVYLREETIDLISKGVTKFISEFQDEIYFKDIDMLRGEVSLLYSIGGYVRSVVHVEGNNDVYISLSAMS